MHRTIEPAILYLGTPVAILSTLNEDGSANLSPMSSLWWLGWSCMLGLDATSQSVANIRRTGECVINLPSASGRDMVDRLAKLTGSRTLPVHKKALGYRTETDKFGAAGLTAVDSTCVAPPRVLECPIQLEATVAGIRPFAAGDKRMAIPACAIEATIACVHADESVIARDNPDRIDPDLWRPLIMSFRQFYGLTDRLGPSRLGDGPEAQYAPWKRGPIRGAIVGAIMKLANRKFAMPDQS